MRALLIVGNWKMNMTTVQATGLVDSIARQVERRQDVEVVVCPPFTALAPVRDELRDTHIKLGAQDMFWQDSGAYTGQISPAMLLDLQVQYVIVGHSETRGRFGSPDEDLVHVLPYFSETDETVNKKIRCALFHSIRPILCVGETLDEREAGKTDEVALRQLERALNGIDADEAYGLEVAYEPVWAIGTGQVCDEAEANRVCGLIRGGLESLTDSDASESIRVLYGGSVKASNSGPLLRQSEIDGLLVGGASLHTEEFVQIVFSAQHE
jgi:triosephosphate isomerase